MRSTRWLLISAFGSMLLAAAPLSCNGESGLTGDQCSDGVDNDADGMVDFPDDLGCVSEDDADESSRTEPQCKDGRDNDGDGKRDGNDPGCFAPHQDSEEDDCPDGPGCPQCSDGKDNDGNGQTDYPDDSGGCEKASDGDEYTRNPVACGAALVINPLPNDGMISGTLDAAKPSSLTSPTCGGAGSEFVYELRITEPKVIVVTTEGSTADTVVYLRSSDCQNPTTELACNDDISASNDKSSVTKAITTPGTYFLIIDAHDSASAGAFAGKVTYFAGEGTDCQGPTDCGPGLICRQPVGMNKKVCAKHVCEDTVDEDGDGKVGFPTDPGCTTATDDDESDSCPGVGPNCPECADGVDNDLDGKTDFGSGGDTTCSSSSSASEACVSTDGVQQIIGAMTPGTTVGAVNDVKPACASQSTITPHTAGDKTYRLDVPAMADLTIDADSMTHDGVVALYNSTCGGTAVQCKDTPETVTVTNLAAGAYYFVVDGYSTGTSAYTVKVSGHIQNGASCESVLAQSGAITCANGYACKGTTGSRTCQPATCSDGLDNDGDNKIDFPFDPGCADAADDSEPDPTTLPVCSDGNDNDTDQLTDYPADFGCAGAGGASEKFCTGETDPAAGVVTTKTVTGSTTGKAGDWPTTTCFSSAASDVAYALQLPVPVASLQVDTIGSSFDTVIQVRDIACGAELACDDEGGGSNTSKLTMANVAPGSYAIIVDGYSTYNGAYTLNVRGTVATGTPCSSPLFSGGANAVLVCPAATTCTGTPAKCQ
jgi:large repetitive protein